MHPLGDSPVTLSVPSRGRLTFVREGRRASSLSATGLRGARLTRTRGGAETTVVYTDRELTRPLLDHYGQFKPTDEARQLEINDTGAPAALSTTGDNANLKDRMDLRVTHGFRSSVSPSTEAAGRMVDKMATSYRGSVHGISGRFVCGAANGGPNDDCMVMLNATYNNDDGDPNAVTEGENQLATVGMTVTGTDGTLFFRPDSATATVSLGPAGTTGVVGDDTEYMMFGWWRFDPDSLNGQYTFEIFSDVEGTGFDIDGYTGTFDGTAEYDGTAAGMYVEQDSVTTRQGEFTADVRLTADFDADTLSGEIDGFRARPTGGSGAPTNAGSWVVVLMDNGDANIRRPGSATGGAWGHEFVPDHTYARPNEAPQAVTGTFDAGIANVLDIFGAFGAQR